jgi:hypothetical protein
MFAYSLGIFLQSFPLFTHFAPSSHFDTRLLVVSPIGLAMGRSPYSQFLSISNAKNSVARKDVNESDDTSHEECSDVFLT